jgi:LmbE family N-acetylglucosaminyl deacetylase
VNAPVVVVSPHLDDAVLSASSVLGAHPGSVIVSVFANGPRSVDPLPEWDLSSQTYAPGDDVIAARRSEDVAAAAVLGATTVHLDHWDGHYRNPTYGYGGPTDPAELAHAVAADLVDFAGRTDAPTWVVPLGVFHADHQITACAARLAAAALPGIEWLVYYDLPYSAQSDADIDAAMARVEAMGFTLGEDGAGGGPDFDAGLKARAIGRYASQLPALGSLIGLSIATPERIRRLVTSA